MWGWPWGCRDARTTGDPAGPPAGVGPTEVPWCVPDPSGGQLIVGEGAPIRTLCDAIHEAHFWHQAGTTVLVTRATAPSSGSPTAGSRRWGTGDSQVSMSHDGRLAAG